MTEHERVVGQVSVFAEVDLGDAYATETVEVRRHRGGLIELPGPKAWPVHPHLELYTAGGRVIGRIVRGDGEALPKVVVLSRGSARILDVESWPLSLAPRSDDGFWMLTTSALTCHTGEGAVVAEVDVRGQELAGTVDNGVWVLSQGMARFVGADGNLSAPTMEWECGSAVSATNQALCGITRQPPYGIRIMEPDGQQHFSAVSTLEPLEQVLSIASAGDLLTSSGSRLRRHRAGAPVAESVIQNAGLEDSGKPFVARHAEGLVELTIVDGPVHRLPLASDTPRAGRLTCVARSRGCSLVYGQGYAAWYDAQDRMQSSFQVDEARYADEIFPVAWQLAPVRGISATSVSEVLLSASGPSGLIVVETTAPAL